MDKHLLKNCCCCATLRTGTLIIAGLCIGGSILSIITLFTYKELDIGNLQGITSMMNHRSAIIFVVIYNVVSLITSGILLLGVYKKNWSMFIPWLVYYAIAVVVSIINLICMGTGNLNFQGGNASFGGYIFVGIVSIVIGVYIWFVPFSYGRNVKQGDNDGRGTYSVGPPRNDPDKE